MALGDVIVLDDAAVDWGGTDISAALAMAKIMVQHVVVETPHTFGKPAAVVKTSKRYTWQVDMLFITDGYAAAELDGIVTAVMLPPLGPATGTGEVEVVMKHSDAAVSADNKSYTGTITVPEWEPLGGGAVGEIVRQTRTFRGTGDLVPAIT